VKICWLAPVVFPFHTGGVFHVKSSCLQRLILLFFVVDLPSLLTFDWSFIIIRASNMSRNFCSDSKYGCVREGGSRMPMRRSVAERLSEPDGQRDSTDRQDEPWIVSVFVRPTGSSPKPQAGLVGTPSVVNFSSL